MATSSKSLVECFRNMGRLLEERQQLLNENLPPCLRDNYAEVPPLDLYDPQAGCDADVNEITPGSGVRCGSSKNFCTVCGFCGEHCVCEEWKRQRSRRAACVSRGTTPTNSALDAAVKMRDLHSELCDLEAHAEAHSDRQEFEPCAACDEQLPQKYAEYRHHAELWAETFAKYTLYAGGVA